MSPGLPGSEVLSDTPERELWWKNQRGTQVPCEGTQRYKDSWGFPQTPTHPRHRALQYRILLKLDVYATSYEGSFILSVIQ